MNIDERGKATKEVVEIAFSREPDTIIIEIISATIDALINMEKFAPSCVRAMK